MELVKAKPLKGRLLQQTKQFLETLSIRWDANCDITICLLENEEILATGSRQGATLKCLGVSKNRQGDGLAAQIVTALTVDAAQNGHYHLFLYTGPQNMHLFLSLGFSVVAQTESAILLENIPKGVQSWVEQLRAPQAQGRIGCIIANCNPFTNGHRYLAQTALRFCDFIYFLVLSEENGIFSSEIRLELARKGLKDIPNVCVVPSGPYLVSSATFPDYFIKEQMQTQKIYYDMDITVFLQWYVPLLGIQVRFVGTEPNCAVTRGYNMRLEQMLPAAGVELHIAERLMYHEYPVSASVVRELIQKKRLHELRPLVPQATFEAIERMLQYE